ncbi:MAG: cytochrome C oxidase subunit IV family protein [Planctomycetes bacterium]|nr:cytochrome C oxidase subunit IV family protein [Planctomycetota bacterium]
MSEAHPHPKYIVIFLILAIATAVEIALASYLKAKLLLISLLVLIALYKATLVALYFMHLKFEKKTFVVIVTAPIVLAVVLVLALLPDVGGLGHAR